MADALRVLLIEDVEDDALLLSAALVAGGFAPAVTRVETEAALRAALAAGGWDVVISDLRLPRFDGMRAPAMVTEMDPDLPVILVSGKTGEETAVEAMRAGAVDYLLKDHLTRLAPVIRRELRETVIRQERREAEARLRESEARFRSLFEDNRAVMLLIDPETGSIVDANHAAAAYYGYPLDTLRHMNIGDMNTLPPAAITAEMARAKAEERRHFLFRHRLASGEVRDVESYAGPIAVGGKTLLYSIIFDVTERRRAEEQLRLFHRAVEQSPATIIITDTQSRIIYANSKLTEITGYTVDEVLGATPSLFKSGLTPPEVYDQLWRTIRAGGEWRGIFCNKKKDGELYWESASISAIRDAAGTITHYLAVKEDITAQRRAAEERER
ncbi:MAG TPA: PAS domain S-box protein, partial [Armatimonadota bacterium]|nr:PAS domain S-box protein [Armatimonadota bacterium]